MYRPDNFVAFFVNICRKTGKIRMSRVTFLCLPRSSKFPKYEQRGKRLNLFCFLKSDVISYYSGASLLKKVGKGNLLRCFDTRTRTCPVLLKMYVKTYYCIF